MKLIPIAAALALLAGGPPVGAATTAGLAIADPGLKAAKTLAVSSPKITSGGAIPDEYSSYGKSVSPPLAWGKGPYGTRSFALILEDPDAPMPTPFVHWVVWNIPAGVGQAAEGAVPAGAEQGKLMFVNTTGYFGPHPPAGPAHHYHFQVFALDRTLDAPAGADRGAVVAAMKGHVLASGELVATYQKQ
jgi:Raf kinase inhibitor-like YbhB/YbcL family protein